MNPVSPMAIFPNWTGPWPRLQKDRLIYALLRSFFFCLSECMLLQKYNNRMLDTSYVYNNANQTYNLPVKLLVPNFSKFVSISPLKIGIGLGWGLSGGVGAKPASTMFSSIPFSSSLTTSSKSSCGNRGASWMSCSCRSRSCIPTIRL